MLKLSLSFAVSIAGAQFASAAQATIGDPGTQPIFRCVIERLKVDGLPLVEHGWCTRIGAKENIIPLMTDQGQHTIFGIRPEDVHPIIPAPPIPKHQRRLE